MSVDKLVQSRVRLEDHYLASSELYHINDTLSERKLPDDYSLPVLEE